MKSRLSLIAIAIVCCLIISAASFAAKGNRKRKRGGDTQPATTTAPATQAAATPVNKYCAVEQDNKVDPKVPTIVYNGQVIGFCCEDCAPTFKKNPEKYLKTMK